ncbi:hypothetical protein PUN28_001197 [Cardiocondyla obscurior]|uniref:Cytochrome P450 n=1 Tax=Cardiocondyla obscurior TaxID=286306 RepID=A0AAW2H3Q5_9HYME
MFLAILLSIILIYFVYNFYVRYGPYGRLISRVPGPSGFPIIGNILILQGSQEELWKFFISLHKRYYPNWKIWGFHTSLVSISHPDDFEKVLSNTKEHLSKGFIYTLFEPWLGTGLLTSEGIVKKLMINFAMQFLI